MMRLTTVLLLPLLLAMAAELQAAAAAAAPAPAAAPKAAPAASAAAPKPQAAAPAAAPKAPAATAAAIACPFDNIVTVDAPGELVVQPGVSAIYVLQARGEYTLAPTVIEGGVTVCVEAGVGLTADDVVINQPANAALHFDVKVGGGGNGTTAKGGALKLERVTLFGAPRGVPLPAGGVRVSGGSSVFEAKATKFVRCGYASNARAVTVIGASALLTDVTITESPQGGAAVLAGGLLQHAGLKSGTVYSKNTAVVEGGALSVSGENAFGEPSSATFVNSAVFVDNSVIARGGALFVGASRAAPFARASVYFFAGDRFDGSTKVLFRGNAVRGAGSGGGAVCIVGGAVVSNARVHEFLDNSARGGSSGGAIYLKAAGGADLSPPRLSFVASREDGMRLRLRNNSAAEGGALFAGQGAAVVVSGAADVEFDANVATGVSSGLSSRPGLGGAVLVERGASAGFHTNGTGVNFTSNLSGGIAGALVAVGDGAVVEFSGAAETRFVGNKATPATSAYPNTDGGAVSADVGGRIVFGAAATILRDNRVEADATDDGATAVGGGIAIGRVSAATVELLSPRACVTNNSALSAGGGIWVGAGSRLVLSSGVNLGGNTPQDLYVSPGGAAACPPPSTPAGGGSYKIGGAACAAGCLPAGSTTCACPSGGAFSAAACACVACDPKAQACCAADGSAFLPPGSACKATLPVVGGTCDGVCSPFHGNACKPLPTCLLQAKAAIASKVFGRRRRMA